MVSRSFTPLSITAPTQSSSGAEAEASHNAFHSCCGGVRSRSGRRTLARPGHSRSQCYTQSIDQSLLVTCADLPENVLLAAQSLMF